MVVEVFMMGGRAVEAVIDTYGAGVNGLSAETAPSLLQRDLMESKWNAGVQVIL